MRIRNVHASANISIAPMIDNTEFLRQYKRVVETDRTTSGKSRGKHRGDVTLCRGGHSTVTLLDVATHCGVSTATVSLALRSDPRISETTTARVVASAQELGYDLSHHQAARRLALRKHGRDILNHVIALLLPSRFHRPGYHADLFQGIMEELVSAEFCALTTYCYDSSETHSTPISPALRSGNVDGLICTVRPEAVLPVIQELRASPTFGARPMVNAVWRMSGCSNVIVDDEGAGYATASHLLDLGHRYLAHLTFLYQYEHCYPQPQEYRVTGARRALAERGLDPDRHLAILDLEESRWLDPNSVNSDGDPRLEEISLPGFQLIPLVEFFRGNPHFTALIGLNDASALRAWRLLENAGFRIPGDISITGFDDTNPKLDVHGENLLTSMRVPLVEIGRMAARIAVGRATGQIKEDQELLIPTEFMLRASTALREQSIMDRE